MTVGEIYEQVLALSMEERKELLKLIEDSFEDGNPEAQHSILEFEGIAAHLADDEDPQDYVNKVRDEWDERP